MVTVRLLQGADEVVELVEAALPQPALARHPALGLLQRLRCEPVGADAPALVELTSPALSSTSRCWMNEGSAIANGWRASDVAAGPEPRRSTTARRGRIGERLEQAVQTGAAAARA